LIEAEVAPRSVEAVADGDVVATPQTLAHRYPPAFAVAQVEDVPRIAFHIALVRNRQLPLTEHSSSAVRQRAGRGAGHPGTRDLPSRSQ